MATLYSEFLPDAKEMLADFGVDELVPFLREKGLAL